jgi:hypothetical protein
VLKNFGKTAGSFFATPLVLLSICFTCILSMVFIFIGHKFKKNTDKYSFSIICAYLVGFICLLSFIWNLYSLYRLKRNITDIPENKNRRPCISQKDVTKLIK